MESDKNIIDIYAAELSPNQKERLLMAYYDYVSLVCCLEEVLNLQGVSRLANCEAEKNNLYDLWPWSFEEITTGEKETYADFLAGQKTRRDKTYCFVSVNHTSRRFKDEDNDIVSTPADFEAKCEGNTLPHRIERYVVAYPKQAQLSESEFLVEGKYWFKYIGTDAQDKTVAEAFKDDVFVRNFLNTLDMLAQYPDNEVYIDDSLKYRIQKETLASATIAPFENMILDALSILAEESHKIIKKTIGHRAGRNYLAQAEKEKMVASSVHLQDYLNIRHLIHHQWDTLDSVGKFNSEEQIKNVSVRRRFLDSYCTLCDKTLSERVKAYFAVREDFIPLLSRLNPFVFIREKSESNSHFSTRIKDYRKSHPDQTIYVETGFHNEAEKKKKFIKNLEKYIGNVEIIDKATDQVTNLNERLTGFMARRKYVEAYSELEYHVCQYALFSGKNLTALNAWNWLKNTKFITAQEAEVWGEYRKLRNTLSHKYTDNELNQEVFGILAGFAEQAADLEYRLFDAMPEVRLVEGNIYRAVHPNGLIVDIDYEQKKILNMSHQKREIERQIPQTKTPAMVQTAKKKARAYTEEYPNGTSITLSGTDILSYRLNNGITLDINKNYLYYNDSTKVYFNNPQRLYMIYSGKEKIILDENLTIVTYVKNGQNIPVERNDCMKLSERRSGLIGNRENLAEEIWQGPKGQKMSVKFQKKEDNIYLNYSDGTVILLKPTGARIWHNGEELTYANRKHFVETYNSDDGISPSQIKMMLDKGK